MKSIDLNCDLGEWKDKNGRLKDAEIMPFISSCNIACGGHIGDKESMRATIKLAKVHNVAIGVHPSYPDTSNFGRQVLEIDSDELRSSLVGQISVFSSLVEKEGGVLHHLKPHGALYNEASINKTVAEVVVNAMLDVNLVVPIYCQAGSKLAESILDAGLRPVYEVFADRAYEDDLTLRSRKKDGAIIHKKENVFEHIHRMVMEGKVKTFSGSIRPVKVNTICLHSDTEGSIRLAREIYFYLKGKGVTIASA